MNVEEVKEESVATGVLSTRSQKSALQIAQSKKCRLNAGPPNLIGWIINFKTCVLYFPLPLC
jgi:hypothetical protein